MRGIPAVLIAGYGLVSGLSIAHAIEHSTKTEVSAAQESFAQATQTHSEASDSSLDGPKFPRQSTDADCEDKNPSSRHVSTLLSRFPRSAGTAADAQCTELSPSDHPVEETHQ